MLIEDDILAIANGGMCCNSYLIVCGEDYVLVDPGLTRSYEEIVGPIEAAGLEPEKIKRVVDTHCHVDHIGANGILLEKLGVEFYAHAMDAPYIESGDVSFTLGESVQGVPVNLLGEGDAIEGTGFKVLHTPGHTAGSICLWDAERSILISGDTVFSMGVGRFDLSGGDFDSLVGSLRRLSELGVEKLLPGHGEWIESDGADAIKSGLESISG